MIIKHYYDNNGKTIYECDCCHKEIYTEETYRLSIHSLAKNNKTIKSVHLCNYCTRLIASAIKKGVKQK